MGLHIKWDITYRCNLMCEHCINGEYLDNNGSELTLDDIIKIIRKIHYNNTIDRIHFLGGEPLVRKDFIEILQVLDEMGIAFGFNSNGLLLNEGNLNKICSFSRLDSIILSMEGATEESNDAIRGKRVFGIILKRLAALKSIKENNPETQFKVGVNTVLMKNNHEEIIDIITLYERYSVDFLTLLGFINEGNGEGSNLDITRKQLIDTIELVAKYHSNPNRRLDIIPKFARPMAIDYARECLGLSFPEIEHQCGAGATNVFLDNRGNIYACDRERSHTDYNYDMKIHNYWDVWESTDFHTPFSRYFNPDVYKDLDPCNECKYLMQSCFPCHLLIESGKKAQMGQCAFMRDRIQEVSA